MWQKWIGETMKKTQKAIETASVIVGETYKVAAEKANEISLKAGDKISEIFINKPDDFTYITPNVVAMGYPGLPKHPISGRNYNSTSSVSMYLENHHAKHYRIINLSEEKYDYTLFNDSVVEYNYHGLPCPSLGLLVKICEDIQSYLEEDPSNIICIHCVNGVGRTLTLVAAYLAFSGVCDTCTTALTMCVDARHVSIDDILPSQKQYLQYLDQLLLSIQPSSEPLLLKKIIMKSIFDGKEPQDIRPIFDIYVNGKLVYITNNGKKLHDIPFLNSELVLNEIEFNIPLKGNVYIRCRNYDKQKQLKTIYSCIFHTGYIKLYTLQYNKSQLDFAINSKELSDNFEIVLQFDALSDTTNLEDNELYTNPLYGKKSYWTDLSKKRNEVTKKEKTSTPESSATPKGKGTEHKQTDSRNYIDEINQLESQLSQTDLSSKAEILPESETTELDQLMKEMDIVTENADIDIENFNIEDLDKALAMNNVNDENSQEEEKEEEQPEAQIDSTTQDS